METYVELSSEWSGSSEHYLLLIPVYHAYQVRFRGIRGWNTFLMAPPKYIKKVCSNGVGAPRRPLEHTNTTPRALDVLKNCN